MTSPILAKSDQATIANLANQLPNGLIIIGEKGSDIQALSDNLAGRSTSEIRHLTAPEGKNTIGVEQIRDLTASLYTTTDHQRVVIVRSASQLTEESQNALLKILEEPSSKLHFILETHSLSSLLPTIISRCQTVRLHRTSPAQDRSLLENYQLDEKVKQQILFLSAGRPQLIRDLASDQALFSRYHASASDAKQILSNFGSAKSLELALKHTKTREDALMLVETVLGLLRHQITSDKFDNQLIKLLEISQSTEERLLQNCNIKLSILRFVI